ncbi:MAG: 23S rRNA (adenine(2503)-C(2))-methyltransferase RlmN [Egibacteraceae bacterium]
MTPIDPYALDADGLGDLLADQPRYRADQVRQWLRRGVDDPAAMTNLPRALRQRLAVQFVAPPRLARHTTADGGLTHKVLLDYGPGREVESVLLLYPRRHGHAGRATVCISTQAGCAMGCPFCATGQAGFRGQLTLGEILRQVTVVQRLLTTGEIAAQDALPPSLVRRVPGHVTNVVFMGMGEPLANLAATVDAVRWLCDQDRGMGLSARSVTVSTVGLVPGIRRLADLGLPLTLAVSLHAPDDALRDELVPVNRQHPLAEVLAACRDWQDRTGRRLTFEYVVIDGINAEPEHARRLAALVGGLRAHVNLIPMNPTPAVPWHAPSAAAQQAFCDVLTRAGVPATVRRNRGTDIDAACGQLYADYAAASGRVLPAAVGAADRLIPAGAP